MFAAVAALSVFAALWGVGGLSLLDMPWPAWGLPIAASVLSLVVAKRLAATAPAVSTADRKRIRRTVAIWGSAEGFGVFLAFQILHGIGRPELLIAAICLVTGLHFLPLARALTQPAYRVTALVLVAL